MNDLFSSVPQRICIEGNPLLSHVCNEILDLPNLEAITSGSDLSVIDRRIHVSLMLPELRKIIPDVEMRGNLTDFLCDPKRSTSFDVCSRARRLCVEKGLLRLEKSAIENSIEHKQRIERSLKG